ncbi:hypothetical protein D9M72_403560 [compost metagenome]
MDGRRGIQHAHVVGPAHHKIGIIVAHGIHVRGNALESVARTAVLVDFHGKIHRPARRGPGNGYGHRLLGSREPVPYVLRGVWRAGRGSSANSHSIKCSAYVSTVSARS